MPKLRIIHKGLLLVAVPLIFGIAFSSVLYVGLSNANLMTQRELMLHDAIKSEIIATHRSVIGHSDLPEQATALKKEAISSNERSADTYKHLKELLKNEHSVKVPPVEQSVELMLTAVNSGQLNSPFLKQLQDMSVRQNKLALNASNSLKLTLWGGTLGGILISILLASFFCFNITNRLLTIVNHTRSISTGTVLSPPLKGDDEIAELDQLLFKSATQIRELELFKKEMVGELCNKLKSPLSSIGAFLQSLESGAFGELNVKTRDWVRRTYANSQRLVGLVSELLSVDQFELTMNPELISVCELIAGSVDTVKELSDQSAVDVVVVNGGGKLFADRGRLLQVLVNLLANAIKFSKQNGKVTVETELSDAWFECRVRDQGCGIPEEFRKQIFEPFKQVNSKDATGKKGTGLGLTISRSIVEQHGGTIGVDSELGSGSTFWFKIPNSETAQSKAKDAKLSVLLDPLSHQTADSAVRPNSGNAENVKEKGRRVEKNSKRMLVSADGLGVLQKGLIIISVPLVFQLAFVSVIAALLHQVEDQTHREIASQQVLDLLDKTSLELGTATKYGLIYVYAPHPLLLKSWNLHEGKATRLLDQAIKLSADSKQIRDLRTFRREVDKVFAAMIAESKNQNSKAELKKVHWTEEALMQLRGWLPEMPQDQVSKVMAEYGLVVEPQSAADTITPFRILDNDAFHMKLFTWLVRSESILEKMMDREMASGEVLSEQHSKMIKSLKYALGMGIASSIVLSILLTLFLLRGLVGRLRHVSANTARLANRDQLDPPIKGGDEISYLDHVLYDTAIRLYELEAYKQELIAIVSHELRTPLMSISAGLELLRTGIISDLTENGAERLQLAQGETKRLIRLINDILDVEKIEAGKFELDRKDNRIADLIATSVSSVVEQAEAKQIEIQSSTLPDAAETVLVDADRILQVLVNLLSSAINVSPVGSTIRLHAQVFDHKQIKFLVSDQGSKLSDDIKKRIFDRGEPSHLSVAQAKGMCSAMCSASTYTFPDLVGSSHARPLSQSSAPITGQAPTRESTCAGQILTAKGEGRFSLALSRKIIELHGGTIGVECDEVSGNTFWFTLPGECSQDSDSSFASNQTDLGAPTTTSPQLSTPPKLKLRKVYLDQVVEAALETVEESSENSGVLIEASGTRAIIYADYDAILQVLVKLLSLAVEFGDNGSSISLDAQVTDNEIEMRVIFSPLPNVPVGATPCVALDSFKAQANNSGLGYCKNLIEMHNGTMNVKIEPTQQLALCIKLPLIEGPN